MQCSQCDAVRARLIFVLILHMVYMSMSVIAQFKSHHTHRQNPHNTQQSR